MDRAAIDVAVSSIIEVQPTSPAARLPPTKDTFAIVVATSPLVSSLLSKMDRPEKSEKLRQFPCYTVVEMVVMWMLCAVVVDGGKWCGG